VTDSNEVPSEVIDYSAAPHHQRLRAFASSVSFRARKKMFERFMETVRPAESDVVLDIGVTPDTSLAEANYFERLYPFRDRVTATSIEDASNLEQFFPGLTFVQTEGVTLPFADHQFDIAFSSAVIEHVGNSDRQREFISELLRVSRRVYVLTPNRWFPVDFHTMLPVVHWLPQRYHQQILRALGREFWAETDNLNLLSSADLRSMFPHDVTVKMSSLRTFGWPSNLMAYAVSS
jgi:SAM-dependent methyltransferase